MLITKEVFSGNIKRRISILLSIVLVLGMLPLGMVSASAAGTTQVTLNLDGGSSSVESFTATVGEAIPEAFATPTKTGAVFLGFFSAQNGGVQIISANGKYVSGTSTYINTLGGWEYTGTSVTLYAKWIAEFSAKKTLSINDGSIVVQQLSDNNICVSQGDNHYRYSPNETVPVTGNAECANSINVIDYTNVIISLSGVNAKFNDGDTSNYPSNWNNQASGGTSPLKLGMHSDVKIIIVENSVNYLTGGRGRAAIFVPATSKLTVDGSGQLFATAGLSAAAIGGDVFSNAGTINIEGAYITAVGGDGAAIGGGHANNALNRQFGKFEAINISGGVVEATANGNGAAIGTGYMADNVSGSDGAITISRSVVKASTTCNVGNCAAIGTGYTNKYIALKINITGSIVTAANISGTSIYTEALNGVTITNSIVNVTNGASSSGSLSIEDNFSFPEGMSVNMNTDSRIDVNSSTTFKNYGTIIVGNGSVLNADGDIINNNKIIVLNGGAVTKGTDGTITNNGTIVLQRGATAPSELGGTIIDENTMDLSVSGGVPGIDYNYIDGVITVLSSKSLAIANVDNSTPSTDRILVADGVSANITFNGVNIDQTGNEQCALDVGSGSLVLTIAANSINTLISDDENAGIRVPDSSSLEIVGVATGSLNVEGGYGSAGTGGSNEENSGTISVSNIIFSSQGGKYGAGIGGGRYGSSDTITINSGNVTAFGGDEASGIGPGRNGEAGNITVNGGNIEATGGKNGAGIGGTGAVVLVYNGDITALGGTTSSGIKSETFTINKGAVTATGKTTGAGIDASVVTINDGSVTATGGITNGFGIGKSDKSTSVTINNGTLIAKNGALGTAVSGTLNVAMQSYDWRKSATGTYLSYPGTAFSYSESDSYIELTKSFAAEVTFNGNSEKIRGINDAIELANSYDTNETNRVTLKILGDITLENSITFRPNKFVTLDLDGFSLDRGLTVESGILSPVIVNEGNLVIIDTSTDKSGKITGGCDEYGGGIQNSGTLLLENGSITGNNAYIGGGINNTGAFTMTGGTISENIASNAGGVYNNEGEFTMTGGVICDNSLEDGGYGGGVCNYGSVFDMSNGEIKNNTAPNGIGGGVCNMQATFNMTGGTISGNSAVGEDGDNKGGGVGSIYMDAVGDAIFNFTGGTIIHNVGGSGGGIYSDSIINIGGGTVTENTAVTNGGGITAKNSISVFGNPCISGNTKGGAIIGNSLTGGTAENLNLAAGLTINVTAPLTCTAPIGITTKTIPGVGSPVAVTSASSADYSSCFISDSKLLLIKNSGTENEQQVLLTCPALTSKNGRVDYDNGYVFSETYASSDVNSLVLAASGCTAFGTPSKASGAVSLFGTGSTITVKDTNAEVLATYTLILSGDIDGDSVCDLLDAFLAERASSGSTELSANGSKAADINDSGVVDYNDYQSMINKALL